MPHPTLHIAQPCAESWDAMTPTGPGRHCAACQKTVVDFSQQTDAEILAYLARAGRGEVCGRMGTDQLNRPLRPATSSAPRRWPAWLAVVLAAGSLRAGRAEAALAPHTDTHRAAQPLKKAAPKRRTAYRASRQLRGTVRDAATQRPLAGVAVFLKGENRTATTDSAGQFSLRLPAGRPRTRRKLVLHFFGYHSHTVAVPAGAGARPVRISLRPDAANQVEVIGIQHDGQRHMVSGAVATVVAGPAPAEPLSQQPRRSFWRWLTRPFRPSTR